jgi:tetratricopeptide (TPR) repeat protein
MARPLKPIDPATSPFGHEFRRWRLLRGLKLSELGDRMGFSHSYLSQVEHGHQKPTRQFVELAERELGGGGVLLAVYENAVSNANSVEDYADLVIGTRLAEVSALVDDEAPGIIDQGDDVERRSALKLAGAAALDMATASKSAMASGHLDPELVRYYEGVTALYRYRDRKSGSLAVAGPVVEHVKHLITRLRLAPERDPVRPRLATAAADAAQLAGLLSFDQAETDGAQHWFRLTGRLAREARDPELHANSVVKLARIQIEAGQHEEALAGLEKADRARVSPASEANIVVHRAHALVAAGQERSALTAFDEALKVLGKPNTNDRSPTAPFISHMSAGHIEDWRGLSFIRLGRPRLAIPSLEQGLAGKPSTFRRSKGESLLNLGNAYLDSGELDEACAMLARAFPSLAATRSQRHLNTFRRLHTRLAPHHRSKSVRHLDEVVRASGWRSGSPTLT